MIGLKDVYAISVAPDTLEIECRQQRYGDYLRELGSNVFDCTVNELHSPERFLEMDRTFSFDIDDRDTLLSQHHEISKTNYNMTPAKRAPTMDTEKEEQQVWEVTACYEPLLRQRITERYPGDGLV